MSLKLGQSPSWVMKNFTMTQAMLFYQKMKGAEFDFAELQARMVWAIAHGWKKPKDLASSIDELKNLGVLEEK